MVDLVGSPTSAAAALVAGRPGESWSYTGVNDTKVSHRWIIDKFPLVCYSTSKNKLRSLDFTGGGPAKWHLELNTDYNNLFQRMLHLSLHFDKPALVPMSVECKFSILNNKMQRCKQKIAFLESIQERGCVWEGGIIGRNELLTPEQAIAWSRSPARGTGGFTAIPLKQSPSPAQLEATRAELLAGDRLTILCELCILLSSSGAFTAMSPPKAPPPNNLIADLGSLLQGGLHSDVTLVAKGKKFQAHMCILSVRSPVFKAMFQHDMRESKEKRVIIPDLSASTVQEMLQHIYTGEVSTLEQSAESLLEAADKYDLASLKSACEGKLRSKLEVKNIAKMLMLADRYHADQLKADCMSAIIGHPQEVQKSEGWDDVNKRQDLLAEVARVLFKQ